MARPPLGPQTAALLVGGLGFVVTALITITVQRAEILLRDLDERAHAESHRVAVVNRGEGALGAVASLAALYAASADVNAEEFAVFSAGILARHPEIRVLEWAPRLEPDDLRLNHLPAPLKLPPGTPSGWTTRYPVWLMFPVAENDDALGLDLGAEIVRAEGISRAIREGQAAASSPLTLVQGGETAILVFEPVYDRTLPRRSPEEREAAATGVVLGAIDADRLLDIPNLDLDDNHAAALLTAAGVPVAPSAPAVAPVGRTWEQAWNFAGVPLVLRYATPRPGLGDLPTTLTVGFAGCLVSVLAALSTWRARRHNLRLRDAATAAARASKALALEVQQRALAQAQLDRLNRELEQRVSVRTEELTRANLRLRDRDAWLRILLDHFPGAVWSVDRGLRVAFASGARLADLVPPRVGDPTISRSPPPDSSSQDVATRELARVLHPAVAEPIVHAHQAALSGAAVTCEVSVGDRTFELDVRPPAGHEGAAVVAVAVDVTLRRRLEAERLETRLQAAQRLESLGMLAGGIAHDFNNLLAAILGNTSLALELLHGRADLEPYLRRTEVAAQRAAELTRGLLDYAGRGPENRGRTDLAALSRELLHLLDASVGRRCTLISEIPTSPCLVIGDASQLRQVLLNLITNAADAAPGGKVTLTVDLIVGPVPADEEGWVTSPPGPGRYVRITVSDSGVGMDADTRRRMFEPFFSTKRTGHGLGLASTLGTVRRHNGAIRVRSRPGEGTRVEIVVPAMTLDALADLAPTVGARVLVVDDDEAIRALAESVLKRAGYEVLLATDGEEGVERFSASPDTFAAVVLDLTMPRLDGAETFAQIRALRPSVPVVISSGYSEFGLTDEGTGGVVLRLPKPYRARQLVGAVEAAIRGIADH